MNPENHTEDLLRSTLRTRAVEASVDLTLDDIRRSAAREQHGARRRLVVGLAAAAVVAVTVPTALALRPEGDGPSPAPSPSPTGVTTPSPSPSPSAPANGVLEGLAQSEPPRITYLQERTVHLASGGTVSLPGTETVGAFAAYHGGWLIADDDSAQVRWYDNTGAVQENGDGLGLFATSADGQLLAFPMNGVIRVGIASGMGEGEHSVAVSDPRDVWPVGFLNDGSLVYNDDGHVKVGAPTSRTLPGPIVRARTVSADGLIGGEDARGRAVVVTATGDVVWSTADWAVWDFSDDGRYVAATNSPTGGDFSAVAILDARTHAVVAQHALLGGGIVLDKGPVFDTDDTLLFAAADTATDERAIVRLDDTGRLTRASDLLPSQPPVAGYAPFVFATGP